MEQARAGGAKVTLTQKATGRTTGPLSRIDGRRFWTAITWLLCAASWPANAVPEHFLCRVDQASQCQAQLPNRWQRVLQQLWPGPDTLRKALKGQGGVTLLTEHEALILLDPPSLQRSHVVLLDDQVIERPPLRNFRTTYYHEIGHVATRHSPWLSRLRQSGGAEYWAEEVLADLYLVWHLLREGAEVDELWPQLHLRNLGLIQARPDWGHWTTPVLMPLLCQPEQLKEWANRPLDPFLDAALPSLLQPPLAAYRRLGERQFALSPPKVSQPYLAAAYRSRWTALLQPTLEWLGAPLDSYLARHDLTPVTLACDTILQSGSPKLAKDQG